MKWITAQHLHDWSTKLNARTDFPGLIADLIQASSTTISDIRFPNGDKGQVRGFDGVLQASGNLSFVPEGASIWEFGVTTGDLVVKANADFDKRTKAVDETVRMNTTFVFATPRTWDYPRMQIPDWLEEKRSKNQWKAVECIDGAQLEHWLDMRPAVAAKHARYQLALVPQTGACSSAEFWDEYTTRFSPALTEEVLLAGREAQAEEIVVELGAGESKISLAADSPDEVIAFVIAAIRRTKEEVRAFLEARVMVVDTVDAARQLLARDGLIYLPKGQARQLVGRMAQKGPTVVSAGGDEQKSQHRFLARPTNAALAKAFTSMGMEESAGYELARRCGRSLVILAREIPSGTAELPEWLQASEALLPALLAGAWMPAGNADREVLRKLGGAETYEGVEGPLRALTRLKDPPVDRVGDVWTMRSSVDAFVHLGHLIGAEHLSRFSEQARVVFSRVVEPPKAEDVFRPKYGEDESHSDWLRDGMMSTLLHMSALHGKANFLVAGSSPQHYVDEIVRGLPNLAKDHRLLSSLRSQLPLLAEAAPLPFFEALEHLLEGDAKNIQPIFDEREDFFAPESPHTSLLWALEVLAWDERHLLRASMCLARLAAVDPGGRLSNRPINSLREIFLSWAPHTNAASQLRNSVLKHVLDAVPSIAWPLLVKLLPKSLDTASTTQKPKYAEASPGGGETLTFGIVWEAQAAVVQTAIRHASLDATRWETLIGTVGNLRPSIFNDLVDALRVTMSEQTAIDRLQTWDALRKEAKRHHAFPDAEWSLHADALARLDELVAEFLPDDPVLTTTWLFDDWMPDVVAEDDDPSRAIHEARIAALRKVFTEQGVHGLVALVKRVKLPLQMAEALSQLELSEQQLEQLTAETMTIDGETKQLASFLVALGFSAHEDTWSKRFLRLTSGHHLSSADTARLLLSLKDSKASWELVQSFGREVDNEYWKQKSAYALAGSLQDLDHAVGRYRDIGRPLAAIEAIHRRRTEVSSPILLTLLGDAIGEINALPRASNMVEYYIKHLFEELEGRQDVRQEELARMEYAYLPFFHGRTKPLTLHKMLVERPEFFVSTIATVFKPAHGEAPIPTEKERKYASAAYELLNSLEILPGQAEGDIAVAALMSWTYEVRRLAAEADRADVVDSRIGHLLAHAPVDPRDQVWPHVAVRQVIESLSCEIVERAVIIERFNMRGAHWAGNGGEQERALAEQAKAWSIASAKHPRTANLLLGLSEMWSEHALEADARAAKDELRR